MKEDLSIGEVKSAYQQAAKVVALYGETYLPLFERLEVEYHKKKCRLIMLERALDVARSDIDDDTL